MIGHTSFLAPSVCAILWFSRRSTVHTQKDLHLIICAHPNFLSLTHTPTGTPQRRPSVTQAPAFFLTPQDQTGDVFEQDYDMLTLRKHATDPEFLNIFREGINLYLAGDWQGAKVLLEKSNTFMANAAPSLGGDGPSLTLLDYMRNQNFEAPSTWKGFRPLTSK